MGRLGSDPARWVVGLFLANFLLQRLSLPGLDLPVTLPILVVVLLVALRRGVVVLDGRRLAVWSAAAGVSGLMVLPQVFLVRQPFVSLTSWGLWVVLWLPVVVRFRDVRPGSYERSLRWVAYAGLLLAGLSVIFVAIQLAGASYVDWFASTVPDSWQVHGFNTTYPLYYGSPYFKSNAWLALEPSFLSFMLGVSLIAGISARVRPLVLALLFLGLLSTTAGSGLAVLGVYLVVLLLTGRIALARTLVVPGAVLAVAFGFSVLGQSITSRLTEGGASGSSTSLRAVEPYIYLLPHWLEEPAGILVGQGAGSSARIVDTSGVLGLQVTTPAKVLFDYGLLGGLPLVVLIVWAYLRPADSAIAFSLAFSMLLLQSAAAPLLLCSAVLVFLWSSGGASGARTLRRHESWLRDREPRQDTLDASAGSLDARHDEQAPTHTASATEVSRA